MKIAVLGGTFNPLHKGHEMIARKVCEDLGYDKVLFVPAFMPPHKTVVSKMTAEDRLAMVHAFCDADASGSFVCEPCEIERGGVSYTYETLAYLTEKYKVLYPEQLEGKLAFILGEESAAEFHKWKNVSQILEKADLIVARREAGNAVSADAANIPSGNYKGDFQVRFNPETFQFPFIELKNPVMKISSSEIRDLIKNGGDWETFVPGPVAEYIKKKLLYKN